MCVVLLCDNSSTNSRLWTMTVPQNPAQIEEVEEVSVTMMKYLPWNVISELLRNDACCQGISLFYQQTNMYAPCSENKDPVYFFWIFSIFQSSRFLTEIFLDYALIKQLQVAHHTCAMDWHLTTPVLWTDTSPHLCYGLTPHHTYAMDWHSSVKQNNKIMVE